MQTSGGILPSTDKSRTSGFRPDISGPRTCLCTIGGFKFHPAIVYADLGPAPIQQLNPYFAQKVWTMDLLLYKMWNHIQPIYDIQYMDMWTPDLPMYNVESYSAQIYLDLLTLLMYNMRDHIHRIRPDISRP